MAEVVAYEAEMAPDLCAMYNRTIAPVVHCYPVEPDRFGEELASALDVEKGPRGTRSQQIAVVREGTRLVGFVHFAIVVDEEEKPQRVGIRFLTYRPGHRASGLALLDHVHEFARSSGLPSIVAFHQHHRYPFYHYGSAFLSDRIGHVQALLACKGYETVGGEVFLDWENLFPKEVDPPDEGITVRAESLPGCGRLPGLKNVALRYDEEIAECVIGSSEEEQRTPAVADRLFVHWLGVQGAWQGKGVGRFLLQRTLNDGYALGYRRAGISTAWDNRRGFALYSNYGFSVSDWTYGWGRELQEEE